MNIFKRALKKYNDIPIPAKASIWFIFCTIIQKCISLVTVPIFTRLMSTTQYGQFTVYNSWLQIFTIITTLRLNWAVFNKGMSKYKNDRDAYTSTMQSLTFMITGVVFVVYLIFHKQINAFVELPTFIMVALFAELFVSPAIDFWTIRKRYEYIYIPVIIRTLVMAVLNAGLGIVAVLLSEEKGYARIISCILVNTCFGISLFVYNRKKGKVWFKKEYAKYAILFNLPLLLHYLSQYVLEQFDRIMIQKMVGIDEAGIYGVAYNAAMMMRIVTQNINNAFIPWQYEKLEKRELTEMDNVLFVIYILVSGCALVFSGFAPEIMYILAPKSYHEAIYVIPPVALGLVFSFMYTTFANVELYYNQNKFTMYISMSGAILNIILNYFGIKMFGYIAAAYTTLICYFVFTASHYFYMTYSVKKELSVEYVFKTRRIIGLACSILGVGIGMILFYDYVWIRVGIALVVGLIIILKKGIISEALGMAKKGSKRNMTPSDRELE